MFPNKKFGTEGIDRCVEVQITCLDKSISYTRDFKFVRHFRKIYNVGLQCVIVKYLKKSLFFLLGSSSIVKPSSKAFLFSLLSFYESYNSTRLDIKPLHRHLAVTVDYNMLKFGDGDLTVNLNNQSVQADIGNVYQAPSVSEPSTFFAGEEKFQADDVEVLIPTGEYGS